MSSKYTFYDNLAALSKSAHTQFKYEVSVSLYGEKVSEYEVISYTEERNFNNYLLPKRLLEVVLPPMVYYNVLSKITPDKPFVPVTMNINLVYYINREASETNITARIPFIQAEFMGLTDKTKASKELLKTSRNADSHDTGLDQVYILRIALFDLDDMNLCKNGVVSGNVKGKSIEELIQYGFKVCKGNNKVELKMNKPDNKSVIKNCIVRALGFKDYIAFLDKEYGIYKSNYNIYVEDSICYLINTEKTDKEFAKQCSQKNDEIFIYAYPNTNLPQTFYSFEVKDNHCQYNISQNNLVDDEISLDAIMRPVEYTINSKGDINKSTVSKSKIESISPTVKVVGGRHRTISKENRNPSFSTTVLIEDLPVLVSPYTIVRYVANNRIGFCNIISSIMVISKGTMTTQLHINSYEKFMEYEVEPKKTKN